MVSEETEGNWMELKRAAGRIVMEKTFYNTISLQSIVYTGKVFDVIADFFSYSVHLQVSKGRQRFKIHKKGFLIY